MKIAQNDKKLRTKVNLFIRQSRKPETLSKKLVEYLLEYGKKMYESGYEKGYDTCYDNHLHEIQGFRRLKK